MKKQAEKPSKAALMPDALANKEVVANCDQIAKLISHVQGVQVMLDRDLAKLYGITTGNLNKAVKRNPFRFRKKELRGPSTVPLSNCPVCYTVKLFGAARRTVPLVFDLPTASVAPPVSSTV